MKARRPAGVHVRLASPADVSAMQALIERSAAGLNGGWYDDRQLAAAIGHVFGVDSRLVGDRSYYLAECDGALAGCGGWSGRRTLFGGDRFAAREDEPLDPATDAARIRAFFVDPGQARRGATALLATSEAAAAAAGFTRLELMATLPGVAFYAAAGFVAGARVHHRAGGIAIPFVPMTKSLLPDQTGITRRPALPLTTTPAAERRPGRAMS